MHCRHPLKRLAPSRIVSRRMSAALASDLTHGPVAASCDRETNVPYALAHRTRSRTTRFLLGFAWQHGRVRVTLA
jgi:hypothetical protein